ncbi:uncharacterized protein LOC133178540 isoform X3 [Saccostrea echinata]|uniref:uncharacterized protein LOC133178540 isoform X3 n=1 Tax=Saccostrea echinata TaxID=191078 RepID=UPI002A82CC24|nr:uncharacterized protein LOC133178540 isoform X3 [Saccostrea echinata]
MEKRKESLELGMIRHGNGRSNINIPYRIIYTVCGHCAEYNARGGKIQEFYIPNCKSCTRDYMSTEAYKYQECYEEVYKKVKIPEKGGTQTETQQQRQQQEQQFKPRVGALGDVSEGNRIRSSRYISFYVFVLCIMTVL